MLHEICEIWCEFEFVFTFLVLCDLLGAFLMDFSSKWSWSIIIICKHTHSFTSFDSIHCNYYVRKKKQNKSYLRKKETVLFLNIPWQNHLIAVIYTIISHVILHLNWRHNFTCTYLSNIMIFMKYIQYFKGTNQKV